MCNAHKHSAGCNCGFGPPYLNSLGGSARDWAHDIIEEPTLIEKGLNELGWTQRSTAEFLAEYSQLLETGLPEEDLVLRINRLLRRRKTVEKEVFYEVLRVPLFRFSAPRVPGACVEYSEAQAVLSDAPWQARIFGMGTGGSYAIEYDTGHRYAAENGECKLIFVPVRIRIARVEVVDGGVVVGEGLRAEVQMPKAKERSWIRGRGVRDLSAGSCNQPEGVLPDEVFDYPLSDASGSPVTTYRSWRVDMEREIFIGLQKVFGGEVRAKVKRRRAMRVDLTLPAGRDYEGAKARGALWWTTP
jgi:hypothetical protein